MRRVFMRIISLASAAVAVLGFALLFMPAMGAAAPKALEVRGGALAHMVRGGSGYGSESCRTQLAAIAAVGGNWVSLTDFASMPAVDQPTLRYGGMSEGRGIPRTIAYAHALGIKVLIKPHVWCRSFGGNKNWPGDIKMTNEADWDEWFKQYGQYVLGQA